MSEQDSKKQILKSTGILGSVQVINILLGIIRVKFLAVLLGPAGVGIAGIYQTTISLISSATGLGLGYSGVRDIAAAAATSDEQRMASSMLVLRRWAFVTGLIGMLVALIFAKKLSKVSFGSEQYAWGIAVLSVTILLGALTGGMGALLQGTRNIKAMASANVLGAIAGLVGSIIIYYFWGVKGIVPALLFTFILSQIITWWFARKIKVQPIQLTYKETYSQGLSMAKLGFFMVVSSLAGNGTMYVVRAFIVQQGGLDAVGHFIASWTISSMYISAIFNAMGADYYPRLSAVQNDHKQIAQLVNEQTEIALLLTAPIIIGMISFISVVIKIFYSNSFGATAQILSWQLAGDFFKVLAWPMGFIILAKAKGKIFIISELVWNGIYLFLVYFGWKYFDYKISGIAFLISYILYVILIYLIVQRIVQFRWPLSIIRIIVFFLPLVLFSFLNTYYFSGISSYIIGVTLTIISLAYSLYNLNKLLDLLKIFGKLR